MSLNTFNGYSDRANRASEAVNIHFTAQGDSVIGKWVALRLSDGGSDGTLYDTKIAAASHQLHENQCAYVCLPAEGMSPRQAELFLKFNEGLYDAGMRLADPDRHIHTPNNREQIKSVLSQVRKAR
jgi:hypothetical protein